MPDKSIYKRYKEKLEAAKKKMEKRIDEMKAAGTYPAKPAPRRKKGGCGCGKRKK